MNESNNRVQNAIPDDVYNQIMRHISAIDTLITPYVVGLTPDERMGLPKINVDNRDYVNDAINEMGTPAAQVILPAYLKPSDAVTDITVFGQAEKIGVQMMAIWNKVEATRILSGSEAYTTALLFKKLAEAGEAAGIPGAAAIAASLRVRFKANGGGNAAGGDEQAPAAGQV